MFLCLSALTVFNITVTKTALCGLYACLCLVMPRIYGMQMGCRLSWWYCCHLDQAVKFAKCVYSFSHLPLGKGGVRSGDNTSHKIDLFCPVWMISVRKCHYVVDKRNSNSSVMSKLDIMYLIVAIGIPTRYK